MAPWLLMAPRLLMAPKLLRAPQLLALTEDRCRAADFLPKWWDLRVGRAQHPTRVPAHTGLRGQWLLRDGLS